MSHQSQQQQQQHDEAPAATSRSEKNSPKILRKRPQSVSLARVLVYDGGGESSSSNNSLNSSTSESAAAAAAGGGARFSGRYQLHQLHLQGNVGATATSEDEAAFRKINLGGSSTPVFGSVGARGPQRSHHPHHLSYPHHSSLTIPSRGSCSIDATTSLSETNLIRVRSSALGKSAPALSQAMVSVETVLLLLWTL